MLGHHYKINSSQPNYCSCYKSEQPCGLLSPNYDFLFCNLLWPAWSHVTWSKVHATCLICTQWLPKSFRDGQGVGIQGFVIFISWLLEAQVIVEGCVITVSNCDYVVPHICGGKFPHEHSDAQDSHQIRWLQAQVLYHLPKLKSLKKIV